MIAKLRGGSGGARRKPRRGKTPIDVRLTVSVRFGDEADDRVTVMNDRRVPLVGSIFDSRDALLRGLSRVLLQAAAAQPRVAAELLPLLRVLRRKPKKT